jgi:uncharacterized protein YgbK (DUF1537 family)
VRRAFAGRGAKQAAILFKKIDSTLRGHVAAELAAARRSLGRRPVVLAPSFPAQKRIVRDSRLVVDGNTRSGDLRALLSGAGLPAAQVDLATVRGSSLAGAMRAALATGARGLACDAVTDADLDRIARAGLTLRPRPLFVGSAGLARALARTLPRKRPAPRPAIARRPVMTVVGSTSPVSELQARHLARDPANIVVRMDWQRGQHDTAPNMHYVLTGGETARTVLASRGIREIRLLGEVEPGVPFGMAPDGTLVCTKAGAFGGPRTLANCVARLKREMTRP